MSLAAEIQQASQTQHRLKSELESSRQLLQDTITPYKICVLVLVRLYLECKDNDGDMLDETRHCLPFPFSDQQKCSIMLLFMRLIKVPDKSFKQLLEEITSSVPEELVSKFDSEVSKLARGRSCDFYEFFERLNVPVKDSHGNDIGEFTSLNKTSAVGVVVRSMLIAFKLMTLEDVLSTAITEFVKYCEEDQVKDGVRDQSDPVPSKWQAKRRITQLAVFLEQNARECSSPVEVNEELDSLIKAYPALHRAHYVKYLNHMRVKEYAGAKDSLHRYFDKIATAGDRSFTKENAADDFNRCSRYASLNLASLYARFGHRDLAVHSVKEAVRLAQETNDKNCLQHSLIWLEHLSDITNFPGGSSSLASSNLSLSGHLIKSLQHSSVTQPPHRVFGELAKALTVQTKDARVAMQSFTKTSSRLSQMMLCASLWGYYGNRNMCNLISHNVLHTHLSGQLMAHCAEAECLALCVLSNFHFHQGEYESAESILNVAKSAFPRPYELSDVWSRVEQQQACDRAFYHADLDAIILACDNLVALTPFEAAIRRVRLFTMQGHYQKALKVIERVLVNKTQITSFSEAETMSRVMLELVRLYIVRQDVANAHKYISDCLKMTSSHHLVYQHALCQLYAAHIQLMSGNAEEGFSIMTQYLPCFLIHGSCYDKGRAQMLYTKCKVARVKPQSTELFTQVILEGLQVLEQAKDNFQACEAFINLQDVLMYMAILSNMLGDTERRNICSFQYRQLEQKLPAHRPHVQSSVIL